MGGLPAAIRAAFSSCAGGAWAESMAHAAKNAPIISVFFTFVLLSSLLLGWDWWGTRPFSGRVLIEECDQFFGRSGHRHRSGDDLAVLHFLAVERCVVVQILPE